ncbi:hypothetical protein [Clostridium botulinum]|uniref:hypothetical protein n=1 Tax=Clostridium botulinum TaxID=1491 RepID=UPI0006AC1127|nr:hypothetical protein [Clostridium botulinum]KOR52861.1 hypothetical protein ADT23_07470 [Clostridium botulinum]NFN91455.1 hypothetical protein [Clostridium botulinum]
MNKAKKIGLEDFIRKATDKYNRRKKVAEIEVEGFGLLTFKRPTDAELLEFKNVLANSVNVSKDENITKIDYSNMLQASKELLYNTCEFLHSPELITTVEATEPFDVPVKVFGIDETISLAQKVNEEFEDQEISKKVKN